MRNIGVFHYHQRESELSKPEKSEEGIWELEGYLIKSLHSGLLRIFNCQKVTWWWHHRLVMVYSFADIFGKRRQWKTGWYLKFLYKVWQENSAHSL